MRGSSVSFGKLMQNAVCRSTTANIRGGDGMIDFRVVTVSHSRRICRRCERMPGGTGRAGKIAILGKTRDSPGFQQIPGLWKAG